MDLKGGGRGGKGMKRNETKQRNEKERKIERNKKQSFSMLKLKPPLPSSALLRLAYHGAHTDNKT